MAIAKPSIAKENEIKLIICLVVELKPLTKSIMPTLLLDVIIVITTGRDKLNIAY